MNWTAVVWLIGLGFLEATVGIMSFARRDLADA